jgi:Synergist-CTERM protein sorting domain-containing protein
VTITNQGCECNGTGGGAGWLLLLLPTLAIRRRQHR